MAKITFRQSSVELEFGCQSALERGSDAILMMVGSSRSDQARFEQIDLGAAVHLAFDELEFGDLAFGLAVGPWLRNRGPDGGLVPVDAGRERRDEAGSASVIHVSMLAVALVRMIVWKRSTSRRPSASWGTPASTAATNTVSALLR